MKKLLSLLIGSVSLLGITSCAKADEKYLIFLHDHQSSEDVSNPIFENSMKENENLFRWEGKSNEEIINYKKEVITLVNNVSQNLLPHDDPVTEDKCTFETGITTCNEKVKDIDIKTELIIEGVKSITPISLKSIITQDKQWVQSTIAWLLVDNTTTIAITTLISNDDKSGNSSFVVKKDEFYDFYKNPNDIKGQENVKKWYLFYDKLFQAFDIQGNED